MAAQRILLLGANGQVGQALQAQTLPPSWELTAYSRAECDITNHRATQGALQKLKPDLIINAAAMTAVDQCETEKDQAVRANFEGPANLAAQCSTLDIPLIHLSTDYVFDGKDGATPYKPDDPLNPLSVYGNTKMMGEEAVRQELAWHVILRISSVFSAYSANLLTKTIGMIDSKDELKIVTDQRASPTHAVDVAKALITMSDAILKGKIDGFGTFHLTGSPDVTRLEFVQAIMAAYAPFTDKRPTISPALSSDFPGFAERPAYSVLDCARITQIYGIEPKPWRDGLVEAINHLQKR